MWTNHWSHHNDLIFGLNPYGHPHFWLAVSYFLAPHFENYKDHQHSTWGSEWQIWWGLVSIKLREDWGWVTCQKGESSGSMGDQGLEMQMLSSMMSHLHLGEQLLDLLSSADRLHSAVSTWIDSLFNFWDWRAETVLILGLRNASKALLRPIPSSLQVKSYQSPVSGYSISECLIWKCSICHHIHCVARISATCLIPISVG